MSAVVARRLVVVWALLALVAISLATPGARVVANGEQITLKPSSGPAGTNVTVNGSGFGANASVDILWADTKVQGGKADQNGAFALDFGVPNTKAGTYVVTACADSQTKCVFGQASANFIVTQATPTPSPSPSPTPTRSATPSPTPTPITTSTPTPPPTSTPTPTRSPIFSTPPIDQLAAVPWLHPNSGTCTGIPFAQPYRLDTFESYTDYLVSGQRAVVPSGARSGTMGITSLYDDFGSSNKPIIFDFGAHGESEVAIFVGREQPSPGSGPLTAVLTAYGWMPDGTVGQVASASTVLEDAAIPTNRCLFVAAPSGTTGIRSVSIEYYDQDGRSAYERRWVDDLVLRGDYSSPTINMGARGQVTIITPVDGSTVTQLASQLLHVEADVHWYDPSTPSASIRINNIGATNGSTGMSMHLAADGDPTHWVAETNVASGLVNDASNEIAVFVRGGYSSDISAITHVTITPLIAGNLRVAGIEVNQAVQVPGNRIPLIADKRTVVRVFVQGTPNSRGPWGQVTGQLITTTPDGRTHTHNPIGPTTPLPGPISTWGTDSQLIFMLDSSETVVGTLSMTASITPLASRPQTTTADDVSSTTVRFVGPIGYSFYGILYSFPDGSTNTWSKMIDFSHFLENVFPVSYVNVLEVPGIGETPLLVSNIDRLRYVTGNMSSRLGGAFTYGMWPGSGFISSLCDSSTGSCQTGLDLGARTDGIGNPSSGPPTMAQELSHAAGLMWHAETPTEPAPPPFGFWNPAWPWYHTTIGHPGVDTRDPTSPRVVPPWTGTTAHTHDYMSYAGGTEWVSPYTYCTLLDELSGHRIDCPDGVATMPSQQYVTGTATPVGDTSQPATAFMASGTALVAPGPEKEYLRISGQIAWDAQSATLAPIESILRSDEPAIGVSGSAFTLEIRDAADNSLVSIPFSPAVTHFHDQEPVPFELTVPRPDGAASVLIKLGSQIIGRRDASAHAPTLTIASAPSGSLTVATPISWDAADADGNALTYTVEMSFDGRVTWMPVAVGLDQPSLMLDPATLPGSANAWLRVQASDGFNSAVAVTGPFEIPSHAPSIILDSPTAPVSVAQGAPLLLQAQASDLEDGPLTGESISWTSDRDGTLGSGAWIVVESLSVGTHVITAMATDSSGQSTTVTVNVVVEPGAAPAATTPPEAATTSAPAASSAPGVVAQPTASTQPGGSTAQTSGGTSPIVYAGAIALGAVVLAGLVVGIRRRRTRSGTGSG